jgi:predicted porin
MCNLTRTALVMAGLLACGTVAAQSSVNIAGQVDLSVGSFQDAGKPRLKEGAAGKLSTSYIGFIGSEDLGGGLRAEFVLEQFLRPDTGTSGRFNGDAFFARNAFVGVQGGFGAMRLGRNTTPLFLATLLFNPLGDSFGFSPAIRQLFTPSTGQPFFGDTGWNNSAQYTSPRLGNLTLVGMINAGEGGAGSTGSNTSASARYFAGALGAAATWQRVRNGAFGTPAGWRDQDTVQVAGSYDFGPFKGFVQYTRVQTDAALDTDAANQAIGASIPAGGGRVVAIYGRSRADLGATSVTSQTLTGGYIHSLSKRTELYALLMRDQLTGKANGTTAAAGMKHRF